MSKNFSKATKSLKNTDKQWISDDVKVNTGLPPQVDGQIRCFCKLTISQVVWTVPRPPDLALVRVKWWGEEGDGAFFRPVDAKKGNKLECKTTARYPVRSGPCQFATYLTDMDKLTLDLMTSPKSEVIGQANITQVGQLTNTRPINGIFPVISATGQKLANLHVSLVLEPLLASYDNMGSIPTTDIGTDNFYKGNGSMVIPEINHPMPYSDMPTRPMNTVFKSPTSEKSNLRNIQGSLSKTYAKRDHHQNPSNGVNNANSGPQQGSGTVAITTNGDIISLPNSRTTLANGRYSYQSNDIQSKPTHGVSPGKPEGRDLLSVLVDKGTKLREAMIVSSMHTDLKSRPEVLPNHSNSSHVAKGGSDAAVLLTDDYGRGPNSTLDLLMTSPIRNQDFQLYNMMNGLSPGTSMSSDMGYDQLMSEPEDPLHENSILQDLFYYNSDHEGLGFSDVSGFEHHSPQHKPHYDNSFLPHYDNSLLPPRLLGGSGGFTRRHSLEEPGNQRPPSRVSSLTSLNTAGREEEGTLRQKKTKRKARSRSRSGSRSRSRSNSLTRTRADPAAGKATTKSFKSNSKENAPIPSIVAKPLKTKKKLRSRSRSGSRSRSRKRQSSVDEVSDSDMTSAGQSEISRVSFDPVPSDSRNPKQEGLSVERLTLLGRVHVARVTIDNLHLLKPDTLDTSDSKMSVSKLKTGRPPIPLKSKKANTYFVEYQFPVVASSRDKYTPNAMATEITRVASKNVKNGAVLFNHRSVFPIMFDGAAVERWWKSALVFRLYSKEAGEHTPILIGSGGISLKSILRSENLFVQRDIEIPDTSKNGLLNTSRASSMNSSLNNRNNSHLFGHLKVSVELASDHKEFATVMARTKLAEMSGNVKIVPIGGINPEQARLVKQLHKNKDQPLVKSQTKQIDFPMTSSQPAAVSVTGLPPQSPRRKVPAEDEGDEISRLKQQLKATIAVLANTNPQQSHTGASPLDSGAQVFGGHQLSGALTLHTLLFIQEGRKISITGVPPLHMANKHPGLLKGQPEGRDSVVRNTYLVCRMFWSNESVHSNVCWGTLDPEYNFLQVAPVLMTSQLLERLRDNYMIIEVWDKKVGSENDKLIGMVKLSLHQFYLSFRERKIANALLKSEYPVLAIDNYMPIVDPFSGLHFGQLKVVLAMGSEPQIATLQRLALDSSGMETVPQKPSAYLERQDLINGASPMSGKAVDHQFEIIIEGIRELKLFENMMWGEADCFVQFFFPAESEGRDDGMASVKSMPTMKCFRTATTLCIPDPTFHDSSRHKLTLPFGTPVQRELLTACANSGGGVSGLPFEVWCRYYHPNVRDQLIAKSALPLAKVCAMITMHKRGEPCIQSFSLRLTPVGVDGHQEDTEAAAKSKSVGVLDLTVNYKALPAQSESAKMAVNKNFDGSQVCLSIGVVRAAGLKAAADYMAQLDSSMAYPADVGVNSYVRIKISFLGNEHERITKTVARTFTPEYSHYMDFPCPLLMSDISSVDATSLAELLESAEVVFEVWHQIPSGLHKDFLVDKSTSGVAVRKLAHQTGDVLLGTCIVPLNSLLIRRTGVNGWFPINLPSLGWAKSVDVDGHPTTALDQVAGGLELSVRFAHQDDRDRVINAGKAVGWSPIDLDVEQTDWQDEDSHHNIHNISVSIDQVSFPMTSALITGHTVVDPSVRCYVRYKFYDKGAVVSKSRKLHVSDTGNLLCAVGHKQTFTLSHTAPLQWYLREERLEIQTWVTYGRGQEGDKKPRQRDKLIGSCYLDMESLTDMRRGQQRISGLFPLFKPGSNNLKSAFIRAHMTARVSGSAREVESETNKTSNSLDVSESTSEMDQSDSRHDWIGEFTIDKSPKKGRRGHDAKDPVSNFGVLLAVERAMHLPLVTDKNRSGEICPTTYVSYQSVERSKPTCSGIFPNSTNPVWDYAVETRLSTDYLYKENKNLVLKVWHKPSDASKIPDKASDRVLGFVSVDLTSLVKGLRQICGWYNIMDFNGQCRGQVKVSVTPQDLPSSGPGSSFMLPSFSFSNMGTTTGDVASSIAHQLMSLQQQVLQRMGSLTAQVASDGHSHVSHELNPAEAKVQDSASTNTAFHWQPKFVTDSRADDATKSYLDSSLKRQLQDLENMTQKMKIRLSSQPLDSARSGDVLIGTQSGLSTIHTVSSLSNTRESTIPGRFDGSSFDVGASQESARSHTLNTSSLENAAEASMKSGDRVGGHGKKLLDSGIYSARNFSEKSVEDAPDSHRSDRYGLAATGDNMSTFRSGCNDTLPPSSSTIGTLESGFLAAAAGKTQTLLPVVDNSESSGNSHGFTPATHRSNGTESFSLKAGEKMNAESEVTSAGRAEVSQAYFKHSESQSGSGSARSEQNVIEEQLENDDDDEGEEGQPSERYGSYHKYRDMLDAEDGDDGEEADGSDGGDDTDVVKIVPKSLNNMSTVLSLGAGADQLRGAVTADVSSEKCDDDVHLEVHSAQKLAISPTSPNVNAQDGTSVWCSDDNEDSFFQDVYERNRHLIGNDGEMDTLVDSWLQEQPEGLDKEMFDDWVQSNKKGEGHADSREEQSDEEEDSEADESTYKPYGDNRSGDRRRLDGNEEQLLSSDPVVEHQQLFEDDMRLRLHDLSGHDNGEDTLRDTGRDAPVWQQNFGTSSDEETSRSMWTKKRGAGDFFAAEYGEATSSNDKQQIENIETSGTRNGREEDESEADGISQLPVLFSNAPKSLLSNVELIDTLTSTAQSKTLHSSLSSSMANQGQIQHSSMSGSSVPNTQTLKSTFSEVSSLPSNQRTLDEFPFTLELADSHQDFPYRLEGAQPKVDLGSKSSSSRPDSGSSRASSGKSKSSQQSQRSKASSHSTRSKASHVSSERSRSPCDSSRLGEDFQKNSSNNNNCSNNNSNSSQHSGMHASEENEVSQSTLRDKDKPTTSKTTNGTAFNMNGPHVRQVDSGTNHYDRDSTLDLAYVEGDHSDVPSTRPSSIVMNGAHRPIGDHARESVNGNLRVDDVEDIPNFFMPAEDMQASIRALKMATAAASNLNQDDQRTHNRVKAVSDLVQKMAATKMKTAPLSVKNKQPPSAEEAKRIAKIFSSKMS